MHFIFGWSFSIIWCRCSTVAALFPHLACIDSMAKLFFGFAAAAAGDAWLASQDLTAATATSHQAHPTLHGSPAVAVSRGLFFHLQTNIGV